MLSVLRNGKPKSFKSRQTGKQTGFANVDVASVLVTPERPTETRPSVPLELFNAPLPFPNSTDAYQERRSPLLFAMEADPFFPPASFFDEDIPALSGYDAIDPANFLFGATPEEGDGTSFTNATMHTEIDKDYEPLPFNYSSEMAFDDFKSLAEFALEVANILGKSDASDDEDDFSALKEEQLGPPASKKRKKPSQKRKGRAISESPKKKPSGKPTTTESEYEPKHYIDDELKETDVRMGRGAVSNNHAGNQLFLRIVKSKASCYVAADEKKVLKNKAKSAVGQEVLDTMRREHNTRFLAFCEKQKQYYLVSDRRVHEKVAQKLREEALLIKETLQANA